MTWGNERMNEQHGKGYCGPTGPDGMWQLGDIAHQQTNPFQVEHVELSTQDMVDALNNALIEKRQLEATGEMTRPTFLAERICPKCGYQGDPPKVRYAPEGGCNPSHGKTEHLDRQCRRCKYVWPEQCVDHG